MHQTEINFDGLIGPSHNYAGLSLGNLASAKNAGGTGVAQVLASGNSWRQNRIMP